ncbi:MAG TPA: ATP-binding protein [Solirubrobacteraceae bacterium]
MLPGPGLDSDLIARAQLVVTEVVTNAFLHGGGGEIAVDFWAGDGALDVAVSDGGRGFTPRVLAPDDERGGFGLGIVDTLSETWGTSGHHGPGCVWFQVEWDAAKD